MRYLLIKDWESKRHNKTIKAGTYVIITRDNELDELIEKLQIEKTEDLKETIN